MPHFIESVLGPNVKGTVVHWSYFVFVRQGEILLIDEDDPGAPDVNSMDFETWDDVYLGQVYSRWELRGLWWPSIVTSGYSVSGLDRNGPADPQVEAIVRDWILTIPELGGRPERSTRITSFVLADMGMLALFGATIISTRFWLKGVWRLRAEGIFRCAGCGYDLTGLSQACPECGRGIPAQSH